MVSKVMGLDQVVDSILTRLGELDKAYIIDDYAEGKDTGIIDLVLVGNIDPVSLKRSQQKNGALYQTQDPPSGTDQRGI